MTRFISSDYLYISYLSHDGEELLEMKHILSELLYVLHKVFLQEVTAILLISKVSIYEIVDIIEGD